MNDNQKKDLFAKAIELAKKIVDGNIDPNIGCSKIGEINQALDWHEDLSTLGLIAHEQYDHENLGITAKSCIPDITKEAKVLISKYGNIPWDNQTSFLQISIIPSRESNDFETVIKINDSYFLQNDSGLMGMDPNDVLFNEPNLFPKENSFKIQIARCDCGEPGCGGITVKVSKQNDVVIWDDFEGDTTVTDYERIVFNLQQYESELNRFKNDFTWESPDRTAARLLKNKMNCELLKSKNLVFDWASGRCHEGFFTVSLQLTPGSYQIMVNMPWKKESPEQISDKMAEYLAEPPESWKNVEWISQIAGEPKPPPIVGKNWNVFKGFDPYRNKE